MTMLRVEKTHLPVAALTHPGMKGKNNEDRFGVTAFRTKSQPATSVLLAVLSDGIGGHRAGEIASEMAVNIISQYVADSDGRSPTITLEEAIHSASQAIFEQAQQNLEQQGMGATCACAWIAGDRLYTATVGDSRIYLMREGTIQQLSTDHTWIQEALERGLLQPDQVNGHPNAHVIRRYLGSPTPPEVDFRIRLEPDGTENDLVENQGLPLLPGDHLLLCSDGLTDLVNDDEILEAFSKESLETAGRTLINLANERGGHDNITLVAVQIPETRPVAAGAAAPAPVEQVRSQSRSLLVGCLVVIALAILAGGVAGGWLLYADRGAPTTTPTQQTTIALPTATRSPTPSRTPTTTPTPFFPASRTPIPPRVPGLAPSLTPWRISSPTPILPVVTVQP